MASRRDRTDTDDPEVVKSYRGTGVTPLMLAMAVISVLFVVFLAQNTDDVPIEFLAWEGEPPLMVALLVTMAASAFLTLAVSGVWRRRRRLRRTEREELGRLRSKR